MLGSLLDTNTGVTEFSFELLVPTILVAVAGAVLVNVATAAITLAVSDAYLGRNSSWGDSVAGAFARVGPVVGAAILFSIAIFVGAFGLLVGAFVVGAGLGIFMPALMIEQLGATDSLKRSWRLTNGRKWSVFGAYALAAIIVWIVSAVILFVIGLVTASSDSFFVSQMLSTVASVFTTPFIASVVVVIYFDLRVRKEGFDLEMLASQTGSADGTAAAAGSDHNAPPEAPGEPDDDTWPPPVDG